MAKKLKNLHLTSVDLVRMGANQEADICLYKSAQEAADESAAQERNIFKRFIQWLHESGQDEPGSSTGAVEKDCVTFDQMRSGQENQDKVWRYMDAFSSSLRSIQEDHALDGGQKEKMMRTSLEQFSEAMAGLIGALCGQGEKPEPEGVERVPVFDLLEEI